MTGRKLAAGLSVSTEPANCTGMHWPCPTVQAVGQAIGAGK